MFHKIVILTYKEEHILDSSFQFFISLYNELQSGGSISMKSRFINVLKLLFT